MDARFKPLAELAVHGANVQPGQVVAVGATVGQEDLARAIAAAAYEQGALFVDVSYFDPYVKRARIEHADPETLGFRARSGTTYHIMIASCCDSPGGRATLSLTQIVPPTIDVRLGGGTADTRTGDASTRGSVTCDHATSASIQVQVRQRSSTGQIVVGWAGSNARCDGTRRPWRTLVLSDRAFKPGWARVLVSAQACKQSLCTFDEVDRVIWLSRRP